MRTHMRAKLALLMFLMFYSNRVMSRKPVLLLTAKQDKTEREDNQ